MAFIQGLQGSRADVLAWGWPVRSQAGRYRLTQARCSGECPRPALGWLSSAGAACEINAHLALLALLGCRQRTPFVSFGGRNSPSAYGIAPSAKLKGAVLRPPCVSLRVPCELSHVGRSGRLVGGRRSE